MKRVHLTILFLLALLGAAPSLAQAQTPQPTPDSQGTAPPIPRYHMVQEGENLTMIAQAYGVTIAELQAVNNLTDDALLYVGQPLLIPGGEGEAVATGYIVQAGDTLASVAAAFNTTIDALVQTNRLPTRHYDLSVGQSLVVISRTGTADPIPQTGTPHVVGPGESLLEVAARYRLSPTAVAAANNLPYPAYLFPHQRLRIPSEETYRDLPGEWVDVEVRPLPIRPGQTLSIRVKNLLEGQPIGHLAGQTLRFIPYEDGYAALIGLDAMTEPGLYTLELSGSGKRPWRPFQQNLRIEPGNFGIQYITIPPELNELLNPQVRQEEDLFLETIYTRFTETPRWEDVFQVPVTNTVVTAPYGDLRSYNGGPLEIFHTGVDFGGTVGTPISAPANGVVVFNDTLTLRGNTVILDHGLGVMTAYFHLSASFVQVGEEVTKGQKIAAGGSTGLSNGPHLHWDLRIMNVPVNGLQWTEESFP